MILIILLSIFVYIFYYLASFNNQRKESKFIFIFSFLFFTSLLRLTTPAEFNKDYYGYFDLHNFNDPEDFISFLFSEPYLYLIYKFFSLFFSDKKVILELIYWFNFLITNLFFVWLLLRFDISVWKKVTLFTFYYFLFGFVLLRNAPVYMLFGSFFYYSYRDKKIYNILFTPFMHLSSLPLMITLFHKKKYYYQGILLLLLIVLPFFLFSILPLLNNFIALQNSMSKMDSYSGEMLSVSIFHKLYFVFVSLVLLLTLFIYKEKAMNPILLTTTILYYVFFSLNPVLGFRFSPYVFMAVLLFNFKGDFDARFINFINCLSFFLFPYFIFTFFDTHYL